VVCEGESVKFAFIAEAAEENKRRPREERFPVIFMCEMPEVSRQGYYAWRKRVPPARAVDDEKLTALIADIHEENAADAELTAFTRSWRAAGAGPARGGCGGWRGPLAWPASTRGRTRPPPSGTWRTPAVSSPWPAATSCRRQEPVVVRRHYLYFHDDRMGVSGHSNRRVLTQGRWLVGCWPYARGLVIGAMMMALANRNPGIGEVGRVAWGNLAPRPPDQAVRVFMWEERLDHDPTVDEAALSARGKQPGPVVVARVRNASDQPIYDLSFSWHRGTAPYRHGEAMRPVMPRDDAYATSPCPTTCPRIIRECSGQ
jgi:hypothetical protein